MRYVVNLPAASAGARTAQATAETRSDPRTNRGEGDGRFRVTLVEDDPVMLDLMTRKLRSLGMDVRAFDCGLKALESVRQEPCHAVVTDVVMPEMNGVQLLKEIKKLDPSCHVILTTGMLEERVAREAEEAGALALLRKPFDLDEVAAMVSELRHPSGTAATSRQP